VYLDKTYIMMFRSDEKTKYGHENMKRDQKSKRPWGRPYINPNPQPAPERLQHRPSAISSASVVLPDQNNHAVHFLGALRRRRRAPCPLLQVRLPDIPVRGDG